MKAVYCKTLDGPDALVVREVDDPGDPGPGQVKVALAACGIAYVDVLMSRGEYQVKPELPFVVGSEGAGTITQVGEGVDNLREGMRVLLNAGCIEQVVVDASRVEPIPEHVSFAAAASFRSNYATALYGMQRGRFVAGETLLVHGAAGGVGLAAVDVGKLMGATVIATAGSDHKLEVVKEMGADHVINYSDGFRDQVKEITGGRGADVIYDPVGGDVFDESVRCIAPFGRILVIGFTSGRAALAKTNHLLVKDAEVIGFTLGALSMRDPERAARNQRILLGWLASGRINPYVSHQVPLERTVDALHLITNREVIGKAVVVME